MRNLLQLLVQYSSIVLFIVLEAFCFYLIVRFNNKQQQIAINSSRYMSGQFYEWVDNLVAYFSLDEQIEDLMAENASLRRQLDEAFFSGKIEQDTVTNDSFKQKYIYLGARVINNSVISNNNSITLDRGKRHGVEPYMGVMSSNGIVGIVRNVSDNYCTVMSLLHRQTRISAAIKRNGYFGSLIWRGTDPQTMMLRAIPKHASVLRGDTVVTSGYSATFPKGIMIGTVSTDKSSIAVKPGNNFYEIKVKLENDLSNLEYAYIVTNLRKTEQEHLEQDISNE